MLEINKEYIVTIETLGYEGEGVARINGYPVFIQGALTGERIKIKIIKSKKKFAFGEILEIIDKSDGRKIPDCIYFEKCGGCTLEHLKYDCQLEFKTNRVKECIRKIGGLNDDIVLPTLGMKDGYRYRNKGQFQVDLVDNEVKIGFYSEKSHKIIDIDSCLIQNEESEIIIRIIKKWMKKHSIMPAKKNGAFFGDGILRNIVIRKAFKTNEIMVILVTLHKEISYIEELTKELNSNVTGIKSIIQNINDKDTNWVMGEECITLAGQNYITDYIGDFKFNISALSFFQVNPYQTEVLYNKALEYADLSGSEVVFDAYCGTGTITLFLSQKAKKVYGVEVIEQAIENAKVNATLNNVANAEFFVGKSEEVIPNLIGKGIRPNVIVVDPPRKGCDIKLLDSIGEAKPDRVVYVSCDPSTLARDLKCLEEKGYRTVKVQPVDMFPMTKHVETVALLSKLGVDKHIDVEIKLDEL
ncbi:23S rRNA (uracil(1939)-C(5))-methyltransferase RlmD, partial [Clostridium neonatale]